MLANIPQHTGQAPWQRTIWTSVTGAKTEKLIYTFNFISEGF